MQAHASATHLSAINSCGGMPALEPARVSRKPVRPVHQGTTKTSSLRWGMLTFACSVQIININPLRANWPVWIAMPRAQTRTWALHQSKTVYVARGLRKLIRPPSALARLVPRAISSRISETLLAQLAPWEPLPREFKTQSVWRALGMARFQMPIQHLHRQARTQTIVPVSLATCLRTPP